MNRTVLREILFPVFSFIRPGGVTVSPENRSPFMHNLSLGIEGMSTRPVGSGQIVLF